MDRKGNKRIALQLNISDLLCMLFLAVYPLRHIFIGLDLWDTGYNYANFTYMGMEHMDPMWLFSTYLATAVGHFFTLLPGGGTLVGLNLYTGLTVSVLGVMAYLFCRKKLDYSIGAVLPGVFLAESLCWCPTALLYNYLTYILLLGCVMLLYCGLSEEKRLFLILAGVCLGTNLFVRFSNLPEMALIVGVWAYDFLVCRKNGELKSWLKKTSLHTLWCLLGYLAAAAAFLLFFALRYGLGEYVTGISRLFAMTENASDYKASSMLMGVVLAFTQQLYWVGKIAFVLAVGLILGVFSKGNGLIEGKTFGISERLWKLATVITGLAGGLWLWKGVLVSLLKDGNAQQKTVLAVSIGILIAAAAVLVFVKKCSLRFTALTTAGILALGTLVWLWQQHFCSKLYYSYDSMHIPAIIFLILMILVTLLRIFMPGAELSEKLISGLILISVMIASIGSNNGVYPSMNFLFLAGPYLFAELYEFTAKRQEITLWKTKLSLQPMQILLWAVIGLCCFQFSAFGGKFVFAEATGVQNAHFTVDNNAVLKGVKMAPEKAALLTEATDYIASKGLGGQECIPYGDIPALSFYLSMPAAFNPWSSLDSYSYAAFENALAELSEKKPAIVMDRNRADYLAGGRDLLAKNGVSEKQIGKLEQDRKLLHLAAFMEEKGYELTYENSSFVIFE